MGNSSSKKKKAKKAALPPVLCEPTGLYDSCPWSSRAVGQLIVAKKLAPRYKGVEEEVEGINSECPICFLYYNEVNHVTCCKNDICTECYLQVKLPSATSSCPFCNSTSLAASYTPPQNFSVDSSSSPSLLSTPGTRSRSSSSEQQVTPPSASSLASTTSLVHSSPSSVLSSRAERQQLEQAMQSQRANDSIDFGTPHSNRNSRNRRRSASNESRGGGRVRQDRLSRFERALANSLGDNNDDFGESHQEEFDMRFNLEQVEEMMMMEAIRLSMLESEDNSNVLPPPPPPPPPIPFNNANNRGPYENIGVDNVKTDEEYDIVGNRFEDMEKFDYTMTTTDNNSVDGDVKENSNNREVSIDSSEKSDDEELRLLELALSMSLKVNDVKEYEPSKIEEDIESALSLLKSHDTLTSTYKIPSEGGTSKVVDIILDDGNICSETLSPSAKILVNKIDKALYDSDTGAQLSKDNNSSDSSSGDDTSNSSNCRGSATRTLFHDEDDNDINDSSVEIYDASTGLEDVDESGNIFQNQKLSNTLISQNNPERVCERDENSSDDDIGDEDAIDIRVVNIRT